jgi:DNA-directed RNA polymerase II subunit RPB2
MLHFFNFYRDEEKKMGTLVKEDFGRPDRATTMVKILALYIR